MNISDTLAALREAVPFLRLVPDDIYRQLDPGELMLPEGAIAVARIELEDALDAYVMTYRRDVFLEDVPAMHHLCGHLKPALLNDIQKGLLDSYEAEHAAKGVSFVVYAKPIFIIPVEESALYQKQKSV